MLLGSPNPVLPGGYRSHMSTAAKLDVAERATDLVSQQFNLTPVAASVTGSRLRGLDRIDSDTDILVLVTEKELVPNKPHRALTVELPELGDVEGQVQSLSAFLDKISTSVPYTEFWRSPFLLAEPWTRALFDAVRINRTVLEAHAQRFALHAAVRASMPTVKRANAVLVAKTVVERLSPLMARGDFDFPSPASLDAADWIEQTAADFVLEHPDGSLDERTLAATSRLLRES